MSLKSEENPIESLSLEQLKFAWQKEAQDLAEMEKKNPEWEWGKLQESLEQLHALAHELRKRKAEERAKWQP